MQLILRGEGDLRVVRGEGGGERGVGGRENEGSFFSFSFSFGWKICILVCESKKKESIRIKDMIYIKLY